MFILGLKCWFYSGLKKQNVSLGECRSTQFKSSDVTVAKHNKLPCPPLNSHRTYSTHSSTHFLACQLWASHQACLRLVLMGYTSRAGLHYINAPPVFCGFSCWQDSAGAVLCSSARGQHVHHWHQRGQRPGILWYLIHQHLRDQDYKGVFACVYVQICSCLCALLNKNNVSRDLKMEWKHQKSPSNKSVYITSLCWTASMEANDWWERWCAFVCMFVCVHCEQDEACHSREDWSLLLSEIINSALTLGSSIGSRPSTFQLFYLFFFQPNPRLNPFYFHNVLHINAPQRQMLGKM